MAPDSAPLSTCPCSPVLNARPQGPLQASRPPVAAGILAVATLQVGKLRLRQTESFFQRGGAGFQAPARTIPEQRLLTVMCGREPHCGALRLLATGHLRTAPPPGWPGREALMWSPETAPQDRSWGSPFGQEPLTCFVA